LIHSRMIVNKPFYIAACAWLFYVAAFPFLFGWLARPAVGFFIVPLMATGIWRGRWAGLAAGLISPFLHFTLFMAFGDRPAAFLSSLFIATHTVFCVVGFSVGYMRDLQQQLARELEARKKAQAENEALLKDLKSALAEVKALSGLLPVCANCKKIRDDSGYWEEFEVYISNHSEADFTHSICPECHAELYKQNMVGKPK
jgi:uncharacterized membrane protein YGL010W